jgi:hypothetical protein
MTTRSRGRQGPTAEDRAQEEADATTKNRRTLEKLTRLRQRSTVSRDVPLRQDKATLKPEA